MISKSILQKAAQSKIIQDEQVEPLFQFIQDRSTAESKPKREPEINSTEEPLKFIRSFGDVYITLGVVFLVFAINMSNISGYYYLIPAACFIVIAEWLVRVRRLSLPGMAILISILYFVNKFIVQEYSGSGLFQAIILCLICTLFYLRYKMPFSLLPLAAGLIFISINQLQIDVVKNPIFFTGFGIVVFCAALWFDARDTKRQSNLSQNAFWLHLLAAPLIVHGIMVSMLISDHEWIELINKEMIIVIFFSAFFLLALFIDRRAILFSTQLYMIYALARLMKDYMTNGQNVMIYVLIVLGLFVIYFGAYWYNTRRFIFGFLSDSSINKYIPDLGIEEKK